jgi:transcriptional regulator with XRE-family HTH domain
MNATEARKRRGGSSLLERVKADPVRAARIDRLVASAFVEQLVQAIMDHEHVSAAELARRLNTKPPQISRDLHGGLSRATLSRLSMIAEALGYDFFPAFVPRSDESKRKRFLDMYRKLMQDIPFEYAAPKKTMKRAKARTNAKKSAPVPAKRRVA